MKIISFFVASFLTVIATSLSSSGQVEGGTIITFWLSQDEAVLAADSRTSTADGRVETNDKCKIRTFGDRAVFAFAGLERRDGEWNTFDVTRQVYERLSVPSPTSAHVDISKVFIDEWGNAMQDVLTGDAIRHGIPKSGPLLGGIFIDLDHSGHIEASIGQFTSTPSQLLWEPNSFVIATSGTVNASEMLRCIKNT